MDNNTPKISVIVPVYNTTGLLEPCIRSITSQTLRDIEIIIIDDGSCKECADLCDEIAKSDNRIRVIHQDNKGVSAARNTGISAASSRYIAFVDSDDSVEPEMYELLLNAMESTNADLAACGYFVNNIPMEFRTQTGDITVCDRTQAMKECIEDSAFSCFCPAVWNKLFDSWSLNIVFNEDVTMAEDMIVTLKSIASANALIQVNRCLYHYSVRENSAVTSYRHGKASSVKAHRLMEESVRCDACLTSLIRKRSLVQSVDLIGQLLHNEELFKDDLTILQQDIKRNLKYLLGAGLYNFRETVYIMTVAFLPSLMYKRYHKQ